MAPTGGAGCGAELPGFGACVPGLHGLAAEPIVQGGGGIHGGASAAAKPTAFSAGLGFLVSGVVGGFLAGAAIGR